MRTAVRASEKIRRLGVKTVADLTGRDVAVVYRWLKRLDVGETISARAMRELTERTAATAFPILWADLAPCSDRQAA